MSEPEPVDGGEYIIPARTLRGSRSAMVADIDQAIVGLLALRHLIDDAVPTPGQAVDASWHRARTRSRWRRLLAAVLPAGSGV